MHHLCIYANYSIYKIKLDKSELLLNSKSKLHDNKYTLCVNSYIGFTFMF